MKYLKIDFKQNSLLILITLFLVSCGGAKSGPGTTAEPIAPPIDLTASNWDIMSWDGDGVNWE